MESVYRQKFPVTGNCTDRYGRLRASQLLYYVQEAAGQHFSRISMNYEELAAKGMFWAIIRQKVQITRLPRENEVITLETWPMPATRVAYPRSVIAYDEKGEELFRSISIWVLMDLNTRAMILPGKSGLSVPGTLRGLELSVPGSLAPKALENHRSRPVCFTDLDRNGHMNNTRYLDWVDDLLPSAFHEGNSPREITVCYLSEAREGQQLELHWDFPEDRCLQVDAHRKTGENGALERVFSARIQY